MTGALPRRYGRASKLTPAQKEALQALVAAGGKVLTQGTSREHGGGQPGYGTVRTPHGQVDIFEEQLEALERRGLVKLVKTENSTTTDPSYKGLGGRRVRSWTRWWAAL